MASKILNVIGERYGRLTVIEEVKNVGKHRRFKVVCECGTIKDVSLCHLRNGATVSCGCFMKEQTSKARSTHRMSNSRIFRIWAGIIQRCLNPKTINYVNYGGRGIIVCEEWKNSSEIFLKWAFDNNYNDTLEIDRVNNDGNYCPANCRFVTRTGNARNKRSNHFVEYEGETRTVSEWGEIIGIRPGIILDRLNKLKWSIDKSMKTPVLDNRTRSLYK